MGVISLGNDVSFDVSKSNKELIAVIKDTAYKRITENVLSEFAFKEFINTYGEDIGKLDAFCQRDESIFNVYWNGVDEAALYTVEVYKWHGDKIYHLKDYNAGRNEGFVSISGLVGHGYLFRVIAESRDGKILARASVR